MLTLKQRLAMENMVENGGNIGKAMLAAGYSPSTAKTPQKLTDSRDFQATLEEYGLTDSLIIRSLVTDIKKKPQNRIRELELAAKIKGFLKDNGSNFDEVQRAQMDELRQTIKNWIGAP